MKGVNDTNKMHYGDRMGNVKPTYIKRLADEFMEKHKVSFNGDFEHNKKMVAELSDVGYKKLRNRVAGLITRKINQEKRRRKKMM